MKNRTLLLVSLLLCGASLAEAQPKLEIVGGSKFDLGSVYRGVLATQHVTLKNGGTETLLISRVDVSCGCTGTMVSNDHIAPGDTGSLLITFNSKNFRGKVHKTLTVNSNDPAQPQALIQFEGTVVEEVVVTPEYLWFQDADVGARNTRMLTIKNEGKDGLLLSAFSSPLPGLTLALPADPLMPGASIQLPVVYTPSEANPVLAERITIATSNPNQPELVVAVYGNARTSGGEKEANRKKSESNIKQ